MLIAGIALRLVPWPNVFTADGIRFGVDGDPYYHVLRARKIALDGEVIWRDPGINYPVGADVVWPPAFDAAIAGIAWLTSGGEPTVEHVERVATALPVVLGLASIVLVSLLAFELLGGGALGSATVVALSPMHAEFTVVGRADQHAAEIVLFLGCLLAFARALRGPAARRRYGVVLGGILALSFWTWQGSAVLLLTLAVIAGSWHVAAPLDDLERGRVPAVVALGGVSATLLLMATIAVLGPRGALTGGSLSGVTALAPALCAATAASAAALALLARRPAPRLRRGAEVAIAAAAAVAVVAAVPATRYGIVRGLAAAWSGEPWYGLIREFQPRFGRVRPLAVEIWSLLTDYGLAPVAALGGGIALLRAGPERTDRRWVPVFAMVPAVVFFALALFRVRFDLYAIAPIAILASAGIRAFANRFSTRRRALACAAASALIISPMLFGVRLVVDNDWPREEYARISRRLGAARRVGTPGSVLATWERGHEVRYFSGMPVLATPFGVEGGPGALEDAARFWLAETQDDAEAVLARRGVRWVMVQPPDTDVFLSGALLGVVPLATVASERPLLIQLLPGARRLVSTRLYFEDGLATPTSPVLTDFRLVDEGKLLGMVPVVKLFERVPGAIIRVSDLPPGTVVHAATRLTTRLGRSIRYEVQGRAGADRTALLRVPYSSGRNMETLADEYTVGTEDRHAVVPVSETDVVYGREMTIRLP